jgi:hypothetical protein
MGSGKMIQPTKEVYKLALELACKDTCKNFQYSRDPGYFIQCAERIITEKNLTVIVVLHSQSSREHLPTTLSTADQQSKLQLKYTHKVSL